MLRLDEARRQSQMLAAAAVMSGGGDYTDPVIELLTELEEKPAAKPDRELRKALGLSI